MKPKKIFGIFVLLILIVVIYFLNRNWDMIQMKRGNVTPITWHSPRISDDIRIINIEDKNFDELSVTVTDLYYLPHLEEIHFGLWHKTEEYADQFGHTYFFTVFKDEDGNKHDHQSYITGQESIFGKFQQRQVRDISLSEKEEVYLKIYPIKIIDGEMDYLDMEEKLIYTKETELKPFE